MEILIKKYFSKLTEASHYCGYSKQELHEILKKEFKILSVKDLDEFEMKEYIENVEIFIFKKFDIII